MSSDLSEILSNSLFVVLGEKAKQIDVDYFLTVMSPEGDQFVELSIDSVVLLTPLLVDLGIEQRKVAGLLKMIIVEARKQSMMSEKSVSTSTSESEDSALEVESQSNITESYDPYLREFMEETWSKDPLIRRKALREICPCKIKANVEQFWRRIIEMADDEDENVRYQVLHNLCDGSPNSMEDRVVRIIEKLHNDSNKKIKRQTRRVLTNYRRTGKWNIL